MDILHLSSVLRWFFARRAAWLWTVGLALGLLVLLFNVLGSQAAPVCNRYVFGPYGSDTTTCTNKDQPCRTIQHAIDNADPDDRICVASNGILGPVEYPELLDIRQDLTLEGSWEASCSGSPQNCSFVEVSCSARNVTIHAHGKGRVITIIGRYKPTIDCFTITGGDANGLGGDPLSLTSLPFDPTGKEKLGGMAPENDAGGGIYSYSAAPTIINNIIHDNYGCYNCDTAYGRGGGIYLFGASSDALISNNKINNNIADNKTWGQGGGILLRESDAWVSENEIRENRAGHSAGDGGGVAIIDGAPVIEGNSIAYNTAGQSVMGVGGGIYIRSSGSVTIVKNQIDFNQAISGSGGATLSSVGGGLFYSGNSEAAPTISGNRFSNNAATLLGPMPGYGGGLYLANLASPAFVGENRIADNIAGHNVDGYGGGLYVSNSKLTIAENTFENNAATWSGSYGEGGGLHISGGSVLVEGNLFDTNFGAAFLGSPSTAIGLGGGIALVNSESSVQDNILQSNYATRGVNWGMGGGIFANMGQPQILNNLIQENYATTYQSGAGGGVAISNCLATVQGNQFLGNMASVSDGSIPNSGKWGMGGGLYSLNAAGKIERNVLIKNVAAQVESGYGGGGYVEGSDLWFDGNRILGNTSSPGINSPGGGIRLVLNTIFTFTNNIVAENSTSSSGSGLSILASSSGVIIHNTIAENHGGDGTGVYIDSILPVTLTNNIIISQTTGILNVIPGVITVKASYTLFENNGLDFNPGVESLFAFPGPAALNNQYHLNPGSNAINHALPFSWILHDIDMEVRHFGTFPDLGADEVIRKIWLPTILKLIEVID